MLNVAMLIVVVPLNTLYRLEEEKCKTIKSHYTHSLLQNTDLKLLPL
jgi:hypothetical protein